MTRLMCWHVACVCLIVSLLTSTARANCRTDVDPDGDGDGNDDFVTEEGGCKDQATGLVWSSDTYSAGSGQRGRIYSQELCDYLGTVPEGGGYTDWRLPTLGEMELAIANGLNDHLDFFYGGNFPEDFPEWDGDNGVDHRYRWLLCTDIIYGGFVRINYRMQDGDWLFKGHDSDSAVCVRGQPYDLELDCPACECGGLKKKDRDKCLNGEPVQGLTLNCIPGTDDSGPGGGNGKGKNAALGASTPQVMVAGLMLPLVLVVAGSGLRRRRE